MTLLICNAIAPNKLINKNHAIWIARKLLGPKIKKKKNKKQRNKENNRLLITIDMNIVSKQQ